MLTKWLHSSSPSIITCANCIAANRLQRKTSPQFFVDKVIARSRRPEVSHGSYNGTDVTLPSCLLLLAKLIVLFITYSVSGNVEQNMTQLYSYQNHGIRETFIFTFIEFLDFTHLGFIDDNLQNSLKNRTLSTTCDITTWVKDLMNAHILLSTFFSLFFFLNVGCENGSTQLKKLFLNNIGRKEEKNQRVKCHKLQSRCVPLFLPLEAESFYVHFFFSSVAKATVVFYKS